MDMILHMVPTYYSPPHLAVSMKFSLGTLTFLLTFLTNQLAVADELNPQHPDRNVQAGVPQGKVSKGEFVDSKLFPGTRREYSVYVPAQYSAEQPASLMFFKMVPLMQSSMALFACQWYSII